MIMWDKVSHGGDKRDTRLLVMTLRIMVGGVYRVTPRTMVFIV
jgi:hypothetical protein